MAGTTEFVALAVWRTHAWRVEGREGIAVVVRRSEQRHRTTRYSAIIIIGGMTVAARTAGYFFNFPATPVPSTLLQALHNLMCGVVDLPVPGLRAMSHSGNDSSATWMCHVLGPHTSGDEC
jgi:hypothetical protein